jgi:putative RNA 2'-phosphotransferase
MITEKENTRISKFLSLVLRHQPDAIHIQLDEQGWTDVDVLIRQLNHHNFRISFEELKYVVASNSKKRFAFNEDCTKIRANQGHSVDVELGYEAQEPPEVLYHGTAGRFLESIMKTGLQKQARHHVHLTADPQTTVSVGQRYGKAVVLRIRALEMFKKGHAFYLADNNVWLTGHVPAEYIQETETTQTR